ncbi:MAG TPA: putative porin [Pyrinomonadaceae bacterium]|nr:putative porin [Pyrinomonadaceae bacterium]
MHQTIRSRALRLRLPLLLLCAFFALLQANVPAQTPATQASVPTASASTIKAAHEDSTATETSTTTETSPPAAAAEAGGSEMEEVRKLLRQQQEELERMRALLNEQSSTIESLRRRVEQTEQRAALPPGVLKTGDIALSDSTARAGAADASQQNPSAASSKPQDTDVRLGRVEEQSKKTTEALARQLGSISFSGDLRFRWESFYGQLNALANGDNPAILGNPLSTRQRFRLRARLNMRGQIGKEFEWGLRLATGSFTDAISANQTLTDFYNRKPFALDNAFLAWTPQRVQGLRIQVGKFDVPWLRTEMTVDNDLSVEGLSEIYSRGFKHSSLKNLTFVAWQLPFLERASAFVRNANGTVNLDESGRAGRDLALYGAQLRARIEPSSTFGLTLAISDLFYSGTQFISPVQFFGNQLQLPVTFTIPATATTPAQTITTQVLIPRELLVSGNGNPGVSTATNNAINRDGRLASGFNLIDVIGRLDFTSSKRWPVALIFNFVHNTQAHDVSAAGPGGATVFLNNDEDNGYWAEVQVGKARESGDWLFGYTFLRIEKDAVLTPFNASDILQQSDVRLHRLNLNYTANTHVALTITAFIGQRPNGLLGVFGATPQGSLNGATTRLQFDTTFRF